MGNYSLQNFYGNSQLHIDTNQRPFEDEDVLDENILDNSNTIDSGLEMSPNMDGSRRESYAMSSALFSPELDDWKHDMQSNPSNNPFGDANSHNPFMQPQTGFMPQQMQTAWSMNGARAAGDATPQFDQYTPAPAHAMFYNSNQQALFSPATTAIESIPASPQKDWAIPESIEHSGMPKRMRPHSPGLRSHSPILRRDGIRKKNARFDIPAERNLLNIDQLIQQSTDEQEIKELKQQKRLLRNRQAA
jgi:hypothetical protein